MPVSEPWQASLEGSGRFRPVLRLGRRPGVHRDGTRAAVLAAVRTLAAGRETFTPEAVWREMAAAGSMVSVDTTRRMLSRLVAEGDLERVRRGVLRLPIGAPVR